MASYESVLTYAIHSFFALLAILSMGFLQALTGLDYADQERDATGVIVHSLLQGLLGSPDFATYENEGMAYPYGMILYYVSNTTDLPFG